LPSNSSACHGEEKAAGPAKKEGDQNKKVPELRHQFDFLFVSNLQYIKFQIQKDLWLPSEIAVNPLEELLAKKRCCNA
jgi:hypothetical protein